MVDMYFHLKSEGLSRRSVSLKKAKMMDIWGLTVRPLKPPTTQSWEEKEEHPRKFGSCQDVAEYQRILSLKHL